MPEAGECDWNETKWYEAIGERHGSDAETQSMSFLDRGKNIAERQGLPPGFTAHGDTRYILRPEAIESIFILYRITGDAELMDHAWRMFEAIIRATKTDIAHAAVTDVRATQPPKNDRMESFWLAETLKYFYLIFSEPSLINLDRYVLNTEAHPFKVAPGPGNIKWSGR